MSQKIVPQPQTHSSKASVYKAAVGPSDNTWPWAGRTQSSDNDLRWRPANSRRPGKLEPCRTVISKPGWPSWNPPDAKLETSAASLALMLCGHSIERLIPLMCSHIQNKLQLAHRTLLYREGARERGLFSLILSKTKQRHNAK